MTIDQFNFAGKKAFVRVDFNVPLDENFNITDDTRMRAALPTLKKILADGGSIIIGSHLGRPKGATDKFSLKHILKHLSDRLVVKNYHSDIYKFAGLADSDHYYAYFEYYLQYTPANISYSLLLSFFPIVHESVAQMIP